MKKAIILGMMILSFLLVGCTKEESNNNTNPISNTMEHKHCTRGGERENLTTELYYDIYYTGERLNRLISHEAVTSEDSSLLDTYENAYRGIATNYSGLDHYETNITRSGNTVSFEMNIDYDKIDIPALIRIEGEEDNIFENGIPKVQKWLDLAEKFGTKCELVTD